MAPQPASTQDNGANKDAPASGGISWITLQRLWRDSSAPFIADYSDSLRSKWRDKYKNPSPI